MEHHKKSFEAQFASGYDEMLAREKRKNFLFWKRVGLTTIVLVILITFGIYVIWMMGW